jgi:hypothetical protein
MEVNQWARKKTKTGMLNLCLNGTTLRNIHGIDFRKKGIKPTLVQLLTACIDSCQ